MALRRISSSAGGEPVHNSAKDLQRKETMLELVQEQLVYISELRMKVRNW
jgi:hypothetical protein